MTKRNRPVAKLANEIIGLRSLYATHRDPQHGTINACEARINNGVYTEKQVEHAIAEGCVIRGRELQSFYIVIAPQVAGYA